MDPSSLKHLELIQSVITRMANNSFLLKGWSLTLLSALLALALKDKMIEVVRVALLPIVMFWVLDAFFLRQERLFRKLYDLYRSKGATPSDMSMDTTQVASEVASWKATAFSTTLILFHGGTLLLAVIFVYLTFQQL